MTFCGSRYRRDDPDLPEDTIANEIKEEIRDWAGAEAIAFAPDAVRNLLHALWIRRGRVSPDVRR